MGGFRGRGGVGGGWGVARARWWRGLWVGDVGGWLEGLGEDVSDGSGGLIDAEKRGEGGGDVDGLDAAVIDAGCEGSSEEAEGDVAVVGVRAEVGGLDVGEGFHLKVGGDDHDVPAAVRRVAMGEEFAPGSGRVRAVSELLAGVAAEEHGARGQAGVRGLGHGLRGGGIGRGEGRVGGRRLGRGGREGGDGGGEELLDGGFGFGLVDAGFHEFGLVERDVGQFLVREDVIELFAGRELHIDGVVEGGGELFEIERGGVESVLGGGGGDGSDAVVGGEGDPDIAEAAGDVFVEPGEEGVELGVEGVDHLLLVGGVGAFGVAHDVVGGEADGEQVSDVALAELFALDEGFGEIDLVGSWRRECGRRGS